MTRNEILNLIRDILADVIDQDSLVLTEATTANEVEDWDSINHVKLLLGLESELNIQFDTDEVGDAKNVGELIDVIEQKLGTSA